MHLTGAQKQHLKGLAHALKPVVLIGQKKLSPTVIREIDQALTYHELIKVKLIDQKDKAEKEELTQEIIRKTSCNLIGSIGHIVILFRWQPDAEQRKINLPNGAPPKGKASAPPTPADVPE